MMTTVLIGASENKQYPGWGVANGGIKLYNNWARFIREHGHDAAIVTHDGTFEPWLIDQQPVISMKAARKMKENGEDLRFLTGWLVAKEFIELAEQFYFFDAEMAYTVSPTTFGPNDYDNSHCEELNMYALNDHIKQIATHSRTTQAYYMATHQVMPLFIREWSDTRHWKPDWEAKVPNLVGYMDEGKHTSDVISDLKETLKTYRVQPQFVKIEGDEQTVLETMQKCSVFLGMNMGKHWFWGEGCPRSQQEALHTGCALIAFDVHGNMEYLNNYTGITVPRGNVTQMAHSLGTLLEGPIEVLQTLQRQGADFANKAFGPDALKWQKIKAFLEIT